LVAGLIEKVRGEIPDIRLVEVDITQHPEVAVKHLVMSTPAIVINGKLEFAGVPMEGALRDRIARHRQ